ncbi:MAG: class I SAM-dependent methyltransferase [Thermomicrobiales bacterium]
MDAQRRSNAHYDCDAHQYERDVDHGITPEQRPHWDRDLDPIIERWMSPDAPVVDVGVGTGVLATIMAEKGFKVDGIDPSIEMLKKANEQLSDFVASGQVTLFEADTHIAELPPSRYGAVVTRQVVCHLRDPLMAFRRWYEWLRPGGTVLVIDAYWMREDWEGGEFEPDVDSLPLCCVQSAGTLSYLLEQAGFSIEHRGLMEHVNQLMELRRSRYVVVARKSE